MTITHTYCCQCTDIVSGVTGCFVYASERPFEAVSPVFETLAGLYIWMHRNGWECVHEIETPWGCRQVTAPVNSKETVNHASPL